MASPRAFRASGAYGATTYITGVRLCTRTTRGSSQTPMAQRVLRIARSNFNPGFAVPPAEPLHSTQYLCEVNLGGLKMATPSFRELEHAGWNRKAGQYDDFFATITGQAIEPILDTLDVTDSCQLLDVACGTGALSAAARRRGSIVTGIDFAAEMVGHASRKHPGILFQEGDAMALTFEDASFDSSCAHSGFCICRNLKWQLLKRCECCGREGAMA